MRRADVTNFLCRLSWNREASPSWNPLGHSRPVTGLVYLLLEDQGAMIISAFVQSRKPQERSLNLVIRYFQTCVCRIGHAAPFHLFTHSLYIYLFIYFSPSPLTLRPNADYGLLIHEVSRSHTATHSTLVRSPLDD